MNFNLKTLLYSAFFILSLVLFSCKGKEAQQEGPALTGDSIIDQLTLSLEKAPDDISLLYQRASAYYDKEEFEASISDLEKAMQIDSLKPEIYHLLADNYLDYYRSREALDMMEEAVRLFPDRIPSLLKLSEMQLILNQYENSVFTVNEILRLSPQNSEAYFMLGMNFRAMKDIDRAINSFQTAVENDPELVDAWLILGELHDQKGSKDAIKFYDNALSVAPDKPEVLHSKAFYLQNNDDIAGALDLYKQIILSSPNYTDAYLNSGILYMEQDSLDLAFEQMNLLADVQPQNPMAYYYRSMIHSAYGNYEAAAIDLQNSLNINPDFKEAEEMLKEVQSKLPAQSEGE
ncbi:MAG: tetratricopeptide repeat protein [Saprospiraceae bacterium]|nr:tetratricopeptide repeat protein [Saprospiraceae bacterium]